MKRKQFLSDGYPPYPAYEDVIIESTEFDDDEILNDCDGANCDDEFDECNSYNEDDDFDECEKFESRRPMRRARTRARRLLENRKQSMVSRRKGCCPPRRRPRMVSLSEALDKRTIRKAIRKAVNENEQANKSISRLEQVKKALGPVKVKFITDALKAKKSYLYENKKINGKPMCEYTSKELYSILKTVNEQKKKIEKKLSSLNESLSVEEKKQLKEQIELKNRLFNLLDEELTYRVTLKNILKESDENPLEPLPMGPEVSDNGDSANAEDANTEDTNAEDTNAEDANNEGDETVELQAVNITFDSEDSANEFIKLCVDAGVPEDAIGIKEPEEDEDNEPKEGEDEGENKEPEEGNAEESNESLHYNRFKKLLEADEEDAENADGDDNTESEEDGEPKEDGESEEGDSEEDGNTVVVLNNTDYIDKVAEVLDTNYNIGKDEFEEMIGGEIVDNEDNNEEPEKEEEPKEDEEPEEGDSGDNELTDDDLKDLFGGE